MNNTTELVFILDKSGSMYELTADTIGGFNSLIRKQRAQEGECLVTTVLFNEEHVLLHDRLPLASIPAMDQKQYCTCGCTALIDALGDSISHIANIHKYAPPEHVPAHTMFVIITDGMENASHRYSSDQVKAMVGERKEKYGWEFIFIGANIDSVQTAARYGIDADRAADYHADAEGTAVLYDNVSETVACLRSGKALNADWSEPIRRDYKSRKKNK